MFYLVYILILLFSFTSNIYAIKTHNGTFNFGGVFNYAQFTSNNTHQNNTTSGGGFNAELGYLYLNNFSSTLLLGIDTRLSFGMNYNRFAKINNNTVSSSYTNNTFSTIYTQVGTSLQIGASFESGVVLVDLLGINLGYQNSTGYSPLGDLGNHDLIEYGHGFLFGINLPLGITFILANGFIMGFRQRLDFIFSPEPVYRINNVDMIYGGLFGLKKDQNIYFSYNITFSLGFILGEK